MNLTNQTFTRNLSTNQTFTRNLSTNQKLYSQFIDQLKFSKTKPPKTTNDFQIGNPSLAAALQAWASTLLPQRTATLLGHLPVYNLRTTICRIAQDFLTEAVNKQALTIKVSRFGAHQITHFDDWYLTDRGSLLHTCCHVKRIEHVEERPQR